MDNLIVNFAEKKMKVAKSLYRHECGGSYFDALLILSSAISGIASLAWPGEGIDKKRFVELLVCFTKPELKPQNVSVPLLVSSLEKTGNINAARVIIEKFLPNSSAQIVTSEDVDCAEDEILKVCPELQVRDIRKASYANLFYKEVRSGVVHEYQLQNLADSDPMTTRRTYVSYSNYAYPNNHRKIVFHFEWALESVESVASKIQTMSDDLPFQVPIRWWLEGC